LMVLLLAGHQSAGVYLENVTNGAVENCTIQGLFDCIQLKKASYNVITNCTSFRNCCGIGINFGSDNNTVEYCHTNNFGCSICLWEDVHNNTVSNSTCCGAPIRILNSSYNLIRNCTFTPSVKRNLYNYKKSTIGLELNNSQNNTIKDCTFFLKRIGVLSINSPNNAIAGCHFYLCLKTIIMTVRDR
jgi:parallel beta-helix repeat protein